MDLAEMEAEMDEAIGRLRAAVARDAYAPAPAVILDQHGRVLWREPRQDWTAAGAWPRFGR